jgi:cytochrome c oxidase assembly protein Cox11
MKKIKFWFLYSMVILFIQMLFIVIYNIPIYKIYCELNSYYSFITFNNFVENKIGLLDFQKTFLVNNLNSNSFFAFDQIYYLNYLTDTNFSPLCNNYFVFFFYDFFIYNFFDLFTSSNTKSEIEFSIIYIVYFNTSVTNTTLVEFLSLQNYIYVYPSETYLSFFRIYNPTNYMIKGITIYLLSPFEINLYLYKIQCFCFDEILIYPFESVELPILFYIDSTISNYLNIESFLFLQIQILYLFILNSYFL